MDDRSANLVLDYKLKLELKLKFWLTNLSLKTYLLGYKLKLINLFSGYKFKIELINKLIQNCEICDAFTIIWIRSIVRQSVQ